ncbi:hypothetical protein JCGZ_18228 [Jatropha curcas]|uniref:Aminotransferase-like plant mobile domain-containing protein n=1 Tax=Jatropha curcas TaxID=180498 RepID=A0A067K1U8_JATCU|nr:hypothetical protein JCGZ_18228 [Jatropha curcas]
MSQISEIPTFAYTLEMETLGALPDIPTFDGEPVPVSRNPLTPGTQPLQLLPLPGTEFRGEDPEYWRSFLNDRELSDLFLTPWDSEAWSSYPGREVAELHTRSRLLMRGYWAARGLDPGGSGGGVQGLLGERFSERKTHKTAAHYRAEAAAGAGAAAGPAGVVLGDVLFPPGMEVVLDPGLGLGSGIIIPADLRQAPPPVQLDPKHTTHVPAQRYQEISQRFGFARSYIGRLFSDVHERDLEIGRLRRHQSRQSSAVSRRQAEVGRLRTRLEVEGIPLDSFEEDDDGSSSDDVPLSPPPQAAAGPRRRRR